MQTTEFNVLMPINGLNQPSSDPANRTREYQDREKVMRLIYQGKFGKAEKLLIRLCHKYKISYPRTIKRGHGPTDEEMRHPFWYLPTIIQFRKSIPNDEATD